jgi:hypothetical protein
MTCLVPEQLVVEVILRVAPASRAQNALAMAQLWLLVNNDLVFGFGTCIPSVIVEMAFNISLRADDATQSPHQVVDPLEG